MNEKRTVVLDELKNLIDSLMEDGKDEEEHMKFEDKVYHVMLDLIDRAASTLWMAKDSTTRTSLDAKHTISQCMDILRYWDDYEEEK